MLLLKPAIPFDKFPGMNPRLVLIDIVYRAMKSVVRVCCFGGLARDPAMPTEADRMAYHPKKPNSSMSTPHKNLYQDQRPACPLPPAAEGEGSLTDAFYQIRLSTRRDVVVYPAPAEPDIVSSLRPPPIINKSAR